GALQRGFKQPTDRGFVIDDDDLGALHSATAVSPTNVFSGKRIVKHAPCPFSLLRALTWSPIASTKPLTIARPSPVPPLRSDPSTRTKVSKTRLSSPVGR